jgi:hypothetical protein
MVDIVEEIVQFASKRGVEFSPASRSSLIREFPRLHGLDSITQTDRYKLYDRILGEIFKVRGSPPLKLQGDDIPDAARRMSQQFTVRGLPGLSVSARDVISDCCPYC